MVDRRHAPGGHWHDAYPFVTLHQPSSYYGVNSTPLGSDAIDRDGPNKGLYERAGASEICAYYRRVMERTLLPSGQVRYFPMSDYLGEGRLHLASVWRAVRGEGPQEDRRRALPAAVGAGAGAAAVRGRDRCALHTGQRAPADDGACRRLRDHRRRQDVDRRVPLAAGDRRGARGHPLDQAARGLAGEPRLRAGRGTGRHAVRGHLAASRSGRASDVAR